MVLGQSSLFTLESIHSIINTRTAGDPIQMLRISKILLLIAVVSSFAFGQKSAQPAKSDDDEKLKKQAVEFLRETQADVNNMRSLENRISFGAELASLMWFYDEKEARQMYQGVTGDFRQLLLEFDAQLNRIAVTATVEDDYMPQGLYEEMTDKARLERKFRIALSIRQQIALSLAEHEPDMAMAFYYDSVTALTNPELRDQSDDRDTSFEFQLMNMVADSNAAKAAQFGRKSLEKGVTYQHVELLKKIYAKDQAKGAEFASDIVGHLKSKKLEGTEIWVVGALAKFGDETLERSKQPEGKKPVMEAQDIRDLTDVLAQAILDKDQEEVGDGYIEIIEKYSPGRAAQIRAKIKKISAPSGRNSSASNRAANAMMMAANGAASNTDMSPDEENREKAVREYEAAQKKLFDDITSLGTKTLPKEEQQKVIAQVRKIISQTPGRDKKIMALSLLAAQVAKAGDKDLAAEVMKDAERLVNPDPKNYQDFMLSWMLASGYAEADPDKAFPLLTDTILRLNDTIAAFVKAAEFFDVQGEILDDGEIQVGQFGGSMVRSLTTELKIAEPTLQHLSKADFVKTKILTNTFDRTEVRILAKMLVLRAILGAKDKDDQGELVITKDPGT